MILWAPFLAVASLEFLVSHIFICLFTSMWGSPGLVVRGGALRSISKVSTRVSGTVDKNRGSCVFGFRVFSETCEQMFSVLSNFPRGEISFALFPRAILFSCITLLTSFPFENIVTLPFLYLPRSVCAQIPFCS